MKALKNMPSSEEKQEFSYSLSQIGWRVKKMQSVNT